MQKIQTVKDVYMRSVKKHTGTMLNLNDEQLDKGILNTGSNITPSYSSSYARRKGRQTPDLKVSGDWRRSKFIDVKPDGLNWGATDFKTDFLIPKYTENVFGLTKPSSSKVFNGNILPPVNKVIRDASKLI